MAVKPASLEIIEFCANGRWLALLLAVMAVLGLSACQGSDTGAAASQEEQVMNKSSLAADTRPGLPPLDLWKPGKTETAVFALG